MIQARLFTEEQTETTSDDYYTPKWIFDTLGLHFDLDVASPPNGSPFVPCDHYFTQKDDGLTQDWHGRVWMNPPYSGTGPWVERWIEHNNGVALLPIVKDSLWLQKLWDSDGEHCHLFKIAFIRPDGTKARPWPSIWLWALGASNIEALHNFGKVR